MLIAASTTCRYSLCPWCRKNISGGKFTTSFHVLSPPETDKILVFLFFLSLKLWFPGWACDLLLLNSPRSSVNIFYFLLFLYSSLALLIVMSIGRTKYLLFMWEFLRRKAKKPKDLNISSYFSLLLEGNKTWMGWLYVSINNWGAYLLRLKIQIRAREKRQLAEILEYARGL